MEPSSNILELLLATPTDCMLLALTLTVREMKKKETVYTLKERQWKLNYALKQTSLDKTSGNDIGLTHLKSPIDKRGLFLWKPWCCVGV